MALTIPNRTDLTAYTERVLLDGVSYDLEFLWNDRDNSWNMTVYDSATAVNTDGSRDAIVAGIPVHVGWPLLRQYVVTNKPAGEIVALDTSGKDLDPGVNELGSRVVLVYLTAAEVAALGIGG